MNFDATQAVSNEIDPNEFEPSLGHDSTDTQGYFSDKNPLVVHTTASDCPQVYIQNVQVRYLQPPPLEPHGSLIIKQVRQPQPPPPPPVILRQVVPPPKTPPPLILRQRPPPKPAATPSRTVTVVVSNPPLPPRSVIREITLPPPPKPRDIFIELWRQYPPRPPQRRIVIPAAPPKPYPEPRNQIIIRECHPPRITYSIQRLAILQMNPEFYSQQYSDSLLDNAEIIQQIRSSGLPIDIVEQILSTISNSNIVTREHGFNGFTSDIESSTFNNTETVAANSLDTSGLTENYTESQ